LTIVVEWSGMTVVMSQPGVCVLLFFPLVVLSSLSFCCSFNIIRNSPTWFVSKRISKRMCVCDYRGTSEKAVHEVTLLTSHHDGGLRPDGKGWRGGFMAD
jgi:hypothetical protein